MKKFTKWFRKFFFKKKSLKIVLINEFPKILKKDIVYIECDVNKDDFWYSKFFCPCGCGDILTLNLMDDAPPYWNLKLGKKFSFNPSIRRKNKCKSHFWIIDSKVRWCKN